MSKTHSWCFNPLNCRVGLPNPFSRGGVRLNTFHVMDTVQTANTLDMLDVFCLLIQFYTVLSFDSSLTVCPLPSQAPNTHIWMLHLESPYINRKSTSFGVRTDLGFSSDSITGFLGQVMAPLSSVSSPLKWGKCSACLVILGGRGEIFMQGSQY